MNKVIQYRYKSYDLFGDNNWHVLNIDSDLPISQANPLAKFIVNLNNQWIENTDSSINSIAGNDYYVVKSNSNYNIHGQSAVMYITFKNTATEPITFKIMSRGESSYDYAIVNLDDGTSLYSNKGNTGNSFTSFTVDNPAGKIMTITYRKDSSGNSDLDRAFLAIPNLRYLK